MATFTRRPDGVQANCGHEVVRIEPWGQDAVRVRARLGPIRDDTEHALLERSASDSDVVIAADGAGVTVVSGALRVVVDQRIKPAHLMGPDLHVRFEAVESGLTILEEEAPNFLWPPARWHAPTTGSARRAEVTFAAQEGERIYGLGQHQHGRLDHKGLVVPLVQRNSQVSVPFAVSSRGYGFLWNNPAIGRVEFGRDLTRWVADGTDQIDYWVCFGATPAEILHHYAEATGTAPQMPEWALGLWQSKLRYRTQDEVLEVARGYADRGIPLSVMVIDFMHWSRQGEWRFDPVEWPDPQAMVTELAALGVKLVVSVWPTVNADSETFSALADRGLLVRSRSGVAAHTPFLDKGSPGRIYVHHYDATNAEARAFLAERLTTGYLDHGVESFWLDADEPEMFPGDAEGLDYASGSAVEVGNCYPDRHLRGVYEATQRAGRQPVLLTRSAWAGSQRHGAALWSGDVDSTFEALAAQIPAGLSAGMSGLPWWTSDTGGFAGGDPEDPYLRELMIRWFQFSTFCPLLRMHGFRAPARGLLESGGPNELWSFGPEVLAILRAYVARREQLRPYLRLLFAEAAGTGLPVMRPLYLQFPADEDGADVTDEFMLGPDLLVAPVVQPGATARSVYLPAGTDWTELSTATVREGGRTIEVAAALEAIPLFVPYGVEPPFH